MKIDLVFNRKIKLLLLLGLGFFLYNLITYILLLRDIRAILIMHNFYPAISDALMRIRLSVLERGLNSYPTIAFIVLSIGLFLVYFLLLKEKLSRKNILLSAVTFQLIVLFSWPILSTDIFYYMLSDRVNTVYHQNVWTTPTGNFPNDPFFHLTDWRGQTKIYGPVNQFFYNLPSSITGGDLFWGLFLYKAIVIFFVIATLLLLLRQFSRGSSQKLMAIAAIFLNPLFVIETASSGHNDILMLFFGVTAALLYLNERFSLSALVLALAAGVKVPIIALYPFILGALLSSRKFMKLIAFGVIFLAAGIAIFSSTGVTLAAFLSRTLYSTNLHWQSLPTVFRAYLPFVESYWRYGLLFVLGVQGWRLIFHKENVFFLFVQTLLIYLLFFVDSLWNWYALWLLIFLPFVESKRLATSVIAFTFSSLLAYGILWLSLRFNYTDPIWTVIIYGTVAVPPIGTYLYDCLVKKE